MYLYSIVSSHNNSFPELFNREAHNLGFDIETLKEAIDQLNQNSSTSVIIFPYLRNGWHIK